MKIKGTAVKTIPEFVREKYPNDFANWANSLSDNAKKIILNVTTSGWFPMLAGGIEPTQKVGSVFYNNDFKKGAWELGRFSANIALHGVYKLYVKFSSPGHIISRASRVFAAYYAPSKMEVSEHRSKSVKLYLSNFDEPSEVIECRIAGWIERALEISGCNDIRVSIPESLCKGASQTVFACSWS
jgi:hypothetical protein